MEQHHYFLNTEHRKEDYFSFTDYFMGDSYTFESCADIFSKDNFDYGTTTLLKTVFNNVTLNGTVLDVGCGYGIIGILIKKYYPNLNVKMLDINKNAVMLSCKNANNIGVKVDVFDSNLYDNVNYKVNHIVTNPPIKARHSPSSTSKEILFTACLMLTSRLLNKCLNFSLPLYFFFTLKSFVKFLTSIAFIIYPYCVFYNIKIFIKKLLTN